MIIAKDDPFSLHASISSVQDTYRSPSVLHFCFWVMIDIGHMRVSNSEIQQNQMFYSISCTLEEHCSNHEVGHCG